MKNKTIKIGANCERHLQKNEGATVSNYIEFSKLTAQKVTISRMDSELCERLRIYTVSHLCKLQMVDDDYFIKEVVFEAYVAENSNNPYELAKVWLSLVADAQSWTCKESIIAEYLPAFPKEDFERWGDKNCIKDVNKAWFCDKNTHLDVKIEEIISITNIEISIDDCIDFVRKYKPNAYKNPKLLLKEIVEKRFKEIAGFNIKPYYATHIIKSNEFLSLEIESKELPF